MGLIFGFDADGEPTDAAEQFQGQDVEVETFTVAPGDTVTNQVGDTTHTYTATRKDT
ncbi:hypothetical protein ABZ608_41485 [Streptomyces sp. NPDC013172]|uniref:Uncharacterized protein n=1 Tax=Streptomyces atriruber TaxID=545121 RepID=A0ABV3C131_9ACTN